MQKVEDVISLFDDDDVYTVFGKGMIGSMLRELLESGNEEFRVAKSRMEDRESVTAELDEIRPTHVLLAAGKTGRPSVDWCEDHKEETLRSNVIGCLNLVDVCHLKGIHVTFYGSGCVYHYDKDHPEGSKRGFSESDVPNFQGSFYAKTKSMVQELATVYSNVLMLRIRLPITGDLINCRRNLVTKILAYDRVVSIQNSLTMLPEMLPYSIKMAKERVTGVFNFTNPGSLSHDQILEMYREFIDPDFKWKNFSLEELKTVVKAPRSNAYFDTSKLEAMFPSILPIEESIKKFVFEPAQKQKVEIIKSVKSRRK